jgi:hypothetical protein
MIKNIGNYNMNQRTICKTLAVAVILLFIGLGVNPAIAVVEPITSEIDDCNLCPKLSKQHIVRIKSFIDRLEKYDNELSVLSKLNPEIEEKHKEISNAISTLSDMNEFDDWSFPVICNLLLIIGDCFEIGIYSQGIIRIIFGTIGFFAIVIGLGLGCWPWWWY